MSETLGLVTIGQAPRTDVTPEIGSHLPADVDVREVGALDRFDAAEEIMAAAGPEADLPVYVTRLANGDSVTVDRDAVHELTQKRIRDIKTRSARSGSCVLVRFPVSQRRSRFSNRASCWLDGPTAS
jgi:protein AroM